MTNLDFTKIVCKKFRRNYYNFHQFYELYNILKLEEHKFTRTRKILKTFLHFLSLTGQAYFHLFCFINLNENEIILWS